MWVELSTCGLEHQIVAQLNKGAEHTCRDFNEVAGCQCHMGDEPAPTCPLHGDGMNPPRCYDCGRFLATATKKPEEGDQWG